VRLSGLGTNGQEPPLSVLSRRPTLVRAFVVSNELHQFTRRAARIDLAENTNG